MTNPANTDEPIVQQNDAEIGQAKKLRRIDRHYIVHEIEHFLHFEKGILHTIRALLFAPGQTVRRFLTEDRDRIVKPITFIIITSLIYTVVNQFFHFEDNYIKFDGDKGSTTVLIFKWVREHYGYTNIIMGAFVAFWAKLFFKKYDYNFYEILILICFITGITMLFYTVAVVVQVATHIYTLQGAGILGTIYFTWAMAQFFDQSKPINYLKAIGSYALGSITSMLFAVLLGTVIDLIIKH